MHFSLIQYHMQPHHDNNRIYDFGVILFRDDWTFTSKVYPRVLDYTQVPNPEPQHMGANAIINRLKEADPKSLEDIETFRSKEPNEIQIGSPRLLDEDLILNRLADLYVH